MSNDFPNSPSLGLQYTGLNGVVYEWDGEKWVAVQGSDLEELDARYVRKSGDQMSGDLEVYKAQPAFRLTRPTAAGTNLYKSFRVRVTSDGDLAISSVDSLDANAIDALKIYYNEDGVEKFEFRINVAASAGEESFVYGDMPYYDDQEPAIVGPKQLLNQLLADTRYLRLSGDTMTGPLILSGAPSDPSGAATKAYVDQLIGAISGSLSGGLIPAESAPENSVTFTSEVSSPSTAALSELRWWRYYDGGLSGTRSGTGTGYTQVTVNGVVIGPGQPFSFPAGTVVLYTSTVVGDGLGGGGA